MENIIRDKLLKFIRVTVDVIMCIIALIWIITDPGLLEKYFPGWMCTPIYILMAAGLLIFLITLYDAWNELARARKRCKHEQDI